MKPIPGGRERSPHIVMLAGNDVSNDTRIRKMALSASRLGARVTLLAYASDGVRGQSSLGGVALVRVPIPWRHRNAQAARVARRRRVPVRIGYRTSSEEQAARARARMEYTRAGLQNVRIRRRYWQARGQLVRARRAAQRWWGLAWGKAWRLRDAAVSRTTAAVSWGRVVPLAYDYEEAFAPVIDALQPDLIHAHDVETILVAENAAARARREGRTVPWIYDAHEYVPGLGVYGGRTVRVRAAWAQLEREVAPRATGVVTVSPPIAHRMRQELGLGDVPTVVLNTPPAAAIHRSPRSAGVRAVCGLEEDVPLLVYSGGVTEARGVQTAVEALPLLPGFHLAVVCVPHPGTRAVDRLRDQAARLGVADRAHFVDPVAPGAVVPYLSSADVGLLPLLHYPSHEMALTNKLFEYLHAGLPVVASDCHAQQEFLAETGIGRVHPALDAAGLAAAVREVVGDDGYRRRLRDTDLLSAYTWEAQEAALRALYARLLPQADWAEPSDLEPFPLDQMVEVPQSAQRRVAGEVRLVVGPANMAGQGWAWAKAVERSFPQVVTEVVAVDRGGLDFACDERVPPDVYAKDLAWQQALFSRVCETGTHVLLEAGRPLCGLLNGRTFADDAAAFRRHGLQVGLVLHGSEIRDPRTHRARHASSPYADPTSELSVRLTRVVDELKPLVDAFEGPVYVSTPDLLDDVPTATWLPIVVDVDAWVPATAPLAHEGPPIIVHAPSRSSLKGSDAVDAALQRLAAEGVVDYRRVSGAAPADMPRLLAEADVVLDQFALGSYGVLACEAMALERVVVGHVTEQVRRLLPRELPIVEATVDDLEDVLRAFLADPEPFLATAGKGPAFVRDLHDGRRSAQVLAPFLGLGQ